MSNNKNNMRWSKHEDALLEEEMKSPHFTKESYAKIAAITERSEHGVQSRASKIRAKWNMEQEAEQKFKPQVQNNDNDHVIVQGRINFGAITLEGEFTITGAFTIKPVKNQ